MTALACVTPNRCFYVRKLTIKWPCVRVFQHVCKDVLWVVPPNVVLAVQILVLLVCHGLFLTCYGIFVFFTQICMLLVQPCLHVSSLPVSARFRGTNGHVLVRACVHVSFLCARVSALCARFVRMCVHVFFYANMHAFGTTMFTRLRLLSRGRS